jgi:RNA polymerase sigma-70 factor (ECF subfamily)
VDITIIDNMSEASKTNDFLRLLMANQKRIYTFILGMVPNHEDADDLFQETVLVMWSKFDSFARGTSFTAWGFTIAKYQILSARKKYSRTGKQFSEAALEMLQKDSVHFVGQIDSWMQALRGCIRKLNQRDYELIRMRYEDEITIKTIAERIGRSVQSVYKRIARIHDALLQCVRRTIAKEGLV